MRELKSTISSITGYTNPPILLAFDEMGTIIDASREFDKESSYRSGAGYIELLQSLSADELPGVVITALSSYAHMSDLAPSVQSVRTILDQIGQNNEGFQMLPPFIELPFDIFVQNIPNGQLMLGNVCNVEFISQFGRALYVLCFYMFDTVPDIDL